MLVFNAYIPAGCFSSDQSAASPVPSTSHWCRGSASARGTACNDELLDARGLGTEPTVIRANSVSRLYVAAEDF